MRKIDIVLNGSGLKEISGVGRPKKGGISIASFSPINLPDDLYVDVLNLEEQYFKKFIKKYHPVLSFGESKAELASEQDVMDFKEILSKIDEHSSILKGFINQNQKFVNTPHTIRKKTSFILKDKRGNPTEVDLIKVVNSYLSDCVLQINVVSILQVELQKEERKEYEKQLIELSNGGGPASGNLKSDVINKAGQDRGTNALLLEGKTNSVFSWCVLNLLVDKIYKDRVAVQCECGRFFIRKSRSTKYCGNCDKERSSARVRKLRNKN